MGDSFLVGTHRPEYYESVPRGCGRASMMPAPRRTALAMAREAAGLMELPRLLFRFPFLALKPRGRGQPVLVLPGYGANDSSTAVLQGYLRWLGHGARGWGLGRNSGNARELIPLVADRVAKLADGAGAPIPLIGWSLGGYFAREVAREFPERVEQVITMGTPVVRRRGAAEQAARARPRRPIERPVTAIFSRNDRIVPWQACIDRDSPNVEHLEVETTHVGLGFSPEVFEILATRLAPPRAGDGRREQG